MEDREQDLHHVAPVSPFWIAQFLGWGLYVLGNFIFSLGLVAESTLAAHVILLGQKLIKGAIGLGASLVLHRALGVLWRRRVSLVTLGLASLAGSLLLGAIWLFLVRLAYRQPPLGAGFARDVLTHVFVLVAWCAIYVTVRTRDELAAERERALRADAAAGEARLRMLRYQVNPHFFFNALNSIRALIDESPARARETVTRLAELFRYSLEGQEEATFGDELAAIRNYLAIQKIRYEDQLEIVEEIDDAALPVPMPSFLVHPLVENAVKHGLRTSALPLRLELRAAVTDGRLVREVHHGGRLAGENLEDGTGTGLANIGERLRERYPGRHDLRLSEEDGGVTARLEIPA